MIKSVHFKNFKGLRDATLPLGQFTLIIGPNSSGKSTAMEGIKLAVTNKDTQQNRVVSQEGSEFDTVFVQIEFDNGLLVRSRWTHRALSQFAFERLKVVNDAGGTSQLEFAKEFPKEFEFLQHIRLFSLNPAKLAAPVKLRPINDLEQDGSNLAGALDHLRDENPEAFQRLNKELSSWFPEFDHVLFDTPREGTRSFSLRTAVGRHKIRAEDLSHGVLLGLAFLTIAHLPFQPTLVCFEEPERGVHPRLLQNIYNALHRLAFPETSDHRAPMQVIATTHSPYLLDLFRENPEQIVLSHKNAEGVRFERLSEKDHFEDFLRDAPLGEVWFSGILGGVPALQ